MNLSEKGTWTARDPYGRLTLTLHYRQNAETLRALGWHVMRIA